MNEAIRKPICAVTGSGGYLGSRVKMCLEGHGWEVLEFTRQPRIGSRAAAFQLGTEVGPASLSGVTALVHCAYDFKPLAWDEIHAVNVRGTARLLAAARAAGVARIVCISSISAFSDCRSLYGKAKLQIEAIARDHNSLIIRPGLIYGDQPGAMFGQLVRQVSQASVLPVFGDGSQIQYLVHEQDLCGFICRCAASEVPRVDQPLTAAHEQPWTFRQILEEIARARNKRIRFIPLPWRMVWFGIRLAELCHVPVGFRSDSLVSLMHQNPQPDFSPNAKLGLVCRKFAVMTLKLQPQ
jgi:nucleoside-diphosphate-sugar epimerase